MLHSLNLQKITYQININLYILNITLTNLMKKILFIADARSIHSHKWINYCKKRNFKITWVSLNNSKYDLEKNKFYKYQKKFLN